MEHLSQREYECAYYAHKKFPFEPKADSDSKCTPEFMDLNEAITRSCGASGQQSPWKTVLHTLTTTGTYIIRHYVGEHLEIRQLDGLELLGMVGFSTYYMASSKFPSHQVATRMAGNAFSGFAAGAALFGLLFSLRREASTDMVLSDDDDDGSSSDHAGSTVNLELDFDNIA